MNRFIIYCVVLLASVVSSCNLLDSKLYTQIDKEELMQSVNEAKVVLDGVYASLNEDGMYAYNLSIMFITGTDIAQSLKTSSYVPINLHTPTRPEIYASWTSLYKGIYRANDFIELLSKKLKSYNSADQHLARIYIAEAKVLRAWYNFELVRWWGNIILKESTDESYIHSTMLQQSSQDDVYTYIETQLKEAIEELPYAATADDIRPSSQYRISRGSAYGILMKLYATWAGEGVDSAIAKSELWTRAAAIGDKFIVDDAGVHTHALLPNYETLWTNTCNSRWDATESLFEVSFYNPTAVAGAGTWSRVGKKNGVPANAIPGVRGAVDAGDMRATPTFYRDWARAVGTEVDTDGVATLENIRDSRLMASIANYNYGKLTTPTETFTWNMLVNAPSAKCENLYCAKWDENRYVDRENQMEHKDRTSINWYLLRYADVLLLYAEALNECGDDANSCIYLNMVRKRAFGDSHVDLSLTGDDLRRAIRQERAYELAFEGHRKADLIRWGEYYNTIVQTRTALTEWYGKAKYYIYDNTEEGKHELLPIPQDELDMMNPAKVKQNPKW